MGMKLGCDVYDSTKDVRYYHISVVPVDGEEGRLTDQVVKETTVALCPRGLKRLEHMIDVGTTPPAPRKRKPKEEPDDN